MSAGPAGLSQAPDASVPRISAEGATSASCPDAARSRVGGTDRSVYLRDTQTGRLDSSLRIERGLLYSADPSHERRRNPYPNARLVDKTTVALNGADRLVNETRCSWASRISDRDGRMMTLPATETWRPPGRDPVGLLDTDAAMDILLSIPGPEPLGHTP